MAAQDFWNSTPERNPDVASLEAFGGSIYWGGPRLFHLDAWQAVLFDALDGTTPLLDLAEDVTAALDISSAAAYQILESLVRDLAAAAAVSGVPDPPKAVKHESSPEPSTSSDEAAFPAPGPGVIRTVTQEAGGNTVVTDLHPDGSRHITTQMTMSMSAVGRGGEPGDRSPAEQMPPDSCLGNKLRLGSPASSLALEIDGKRVVIRCDDPEIIDQIRSTLPMVVDATPDGWGPTEIFIVRPLEGVGPPRIFDRMGSRRGRPRSAHDVALQVAELLAERLNENARRGNSERLPLRAAAVYGPDGCVLVPTNLPGSSYALQGALRSRGLGISATTIEVDAQRHAYIPRVGLEEAALGPVRGVLVMAPNPAAREHRTIVTDLVSAHPVEDAEQAEAALRAAVDLVEHAPVISPYQESGSSQDDLDAALNRIKARIGGDR